MANKLSVAFIGTGIMGAPIAGHILDAGYPVTVNNRTKSKAAALVERGAVLADTPADAAANADVVFTMVGYPSEVEELYLAGDGLLACTKPGAVLIDLTTSSPELARDIAEAAQVSGRMAFDCPVTGGESGAIAGTLTAIVGATENDIAPVRDILSTFAATICCFDGAGKGQAAKLANQVSLGACMVGMADALAFAELSGLDLEKTRQMILGGTGKSGAMESLAPKALDGDYKPGFMVEHFIKDCAWRSPMPTTASLRCPAPTWPLRFTTCSMPSVAPSWAPRPSRSSIRRRPMPSPPVWTGRSIVPRSTVLTRKAAVAASMATTTSAVVDTTMARTSECCGGHGHDDGHECCCGHHHGE